MLEKILKSTLVGNVISIQTKKLETLIIKPDYPFIFLEKGMPGIELKLFALMFDSFDSRKNFSEKLFFENLREYKDDLEKNSLAIKNLLNFEKCYESGKITNEMMSFYYNLTSCETLFRVSTIGLLRSCFNHDELEKILFDTIRCTSLTHASPIALVGSILISLSASYIFRNGELKNLLDFLIANIPNSDFVKAALYGRFFKRFYKTDFFEHYDFMRNILIAQLRSEYPQMSIKKSKNSRIFSRDEKLIVSNVIKALTIVQNIGDYYEIIENILSSAFSTEFFSTFLGFTYGLMNREAEDIERFDNVVEDNSILRDFLESLILKVEKILI